MRYLVGLFLALTIIFAVAFFMKRPEQETITIRKAEVSEPLAKSDRAEPAPFKYEARMYGMTGLLGRAMGFSGGVDLAMDAVHGAYPTVKTYAYRHIDKWQVVQTAAANYKRDGYPIILVGHSMGADAAFWVAYRLAEQGIPVAAVFSYDPTRSVPCAADNIRTVVSWRNTLVFQLGGGTAHWCNQPGKNSPRAMTLYNVRQFHTNIDDLNIVHKTTIEHVSRIIGEIRAARVKQVR